MELVTPEGISSSGLVRHTSAAGQDKLHQEFYNVPTKDLAECFQLGFWGLSENSGWFRIKEWLTYEFGVSPSTYL